LQKFKSLQNNFVYKLLIHKSQISKSQKRLKICKKVHKFVDLRLVELVCGLPNFFSYLVYFTRLGVIKTLIQIYIK